MASEEQLEDLPSMEEILKSIRGVITEEDESSEDGGSGEGSQQDEDILELDEPLELSESDLESSEETNSTEKESTVPDDEQEPTESSVLDNIDNALSENDENKTDEAAAVAVDSNGSSAGNEKKKEDSSLLEANTTEKTSATIKELMDSLPKDRVDSPVSRNGTSLEDLVVEAIRPMLAEWLNDNLGTIVRKLVEKEIKKIVPRDDE